MKVTFETDRECRVETARWYGAVIRPYVNVPRDLNQSQGGMYIYVTMMIKCVAPVNLSHLYLENDPAPSVDPHRLRISPWL